ncbi:MAG TPA: MFS transporter [Bryobacteraceae bacterium]|nr:MFS transporter [Bryobacteraceae bacterium]
MSQAAATGSVLATSARRRVMRRLMPFLFLLYVVAYIDRNNVGFAGLQMTGELGFSDAAFGFGSGVFFIGYVLLGIPGAMLVEKWSARKALAITMLAWGCVASTTGLIHTETQFYAARFVLGVTEAAFFPGIITYLGHWFRGQDRAKAVALFMAAIPVSQVIAAPLSAALMKAHWLGLSGWRWLLILEGAPALVCGIVSIFYLTDWPRNAGWLKPAEREWLSEALASESSRASAAGKLSFWQAIRDRDILLLCAAYFGGTMGNYGVNLWMPKMIQRLGHLGASQTALLAAIPAMAAVPAMLLCGWHSDRTGERRWHTAAPRFAAALGLAIVPLSFVNVPIALGLFAIGLSGIIAAYPPLWAIPTTFLGPTAAAASIGLISSLGNLGGFAGPYVIGWFSTRTGSYAAGLWSVSVAIFLSGVFLLMVRGRARHS